jgi:hypothetical protein
MSRKPDCPITIAPIAPGFQSGQPVLTGTRVLVKNLFDYIEGGDRNVGPRGSWNAGWVSREAA